MFRSAALLILLSRLTQAQEILVSPSPVAISVANGQCLSLPADPVEDHIEAPHSGALLRSRCEVIEKKNLAAGWSRVLYRWTLEFSQGSTSEEEAVLFETAGARQVRPVWHARYETGAYGNWRSVTPEVSGAAGGVLLSVMRCVNGTGGCSQEFLHRKPGGRWTEVAQNWLNELPPGFNRRMYKGFQIDPDTLRGEAGLYSDGDANCCPSEEISFDMRLEGDTMRLVRYRVTKQP